MTSVYEFLEVAKLPNEIWTTILNFAFDLRQEYFYSSREAIINVLAEVSHDFHQLSKKLGISIHSEQPRQGDDLIVNYCCANGYGSLLQHVLTNGARPTDQTSITAARFGSLDCLKILEENGFTLSDGVLNEASLRGHVDIAKYLLRRGLMTSKLAFGYAVRSGNIELVKLLQTPSMVIQKSAYFAQYATASGNLEMVKYFEQYIPLNPSHMFGSAPKGSIEILEYYLKQGFMLTEQALVCSTAAEFKQLGYLKFALDHGAPMSEQLMTALAKNNAVELMRELRQKGCPWNINAVRSAAREGRIEALKYLIENGCPFTGPPVFSSLFGPSEVTVVASSSSNIECLKYLIEIGAPMPDDVIDKSINSKTNLAVIKYLRERGCSWSVLTSIEAARFNNIALLKFLHENNCPWDEQTTITAAQEASVECLVYALDNGCPWNATTMDAAALSRSLKVLKICHERGIPWTNQTCAILIQVGVVDTLKYAHENGAPWTGETIKNGLEAMVRVRCFDCFKYAIDNGCPWDPQSTLEIAQSYICHNEIAQWIIENCNVTKPNAASYVDL